MTIFVLNKLQSYGKSKNGFCFLWTSNYSANISRRMIFTFWFQCQNNWLQHLCYCDTFPAVVTSDIRQLSTDEHNVLTITSSEANTDKQMKSSWQMALQHSKKIFVFLPWNPIIFFLLKFASMLQQVV